MANGSVIKEFLVSLGVQVDVKEFFTTVDNMGKAVAKFTLGLQGIAGALKAALIETASALENLYYTAQRAAASVESLKALQYGMQQIGLSAADANAALEGLAMSMRLNPGNESLLRYLGVQTRSVGGAMRDSNEIMGDFITRLNKMPFYIAAQYAETFGINSRTLFMLLQNFRDLQAKEREWHDMARAVGVDLDGSALKARDFMNELRAIGEVIELMWIKVAAVLIDRLRPEIEQFRKFLLDHNREITDFAIEVGRAVLSTADDLVALLPKIDELVKSTLGWKVALEGIADVIAYRIFGPLGLVVSLLYQLRQWEQKGEKDHPGPKVDPEAGIDPVAPETKEFFRDNHEMMESFRLFLYHWIPPLNPNYHKPAPLVMPGAGAPSAEPTPSATDPNYVPMAYRPDMNQGPTRNPNGRDPIGIRQNNPGNLRQWQGAGSSGGFAVFRDAMQGLVAMRDNLLAYAAQGRDTITSIIKRWAPSSENNTGAYIASLAHMLGVDPGARLNIHDPHVLEALMQGITRIENGFNPYSADQLGRAARAPLGGGSTAGGNVTIHQQTDIHVHGSDPHPTGQAVTRQQEAVNSDMVRRFRTAVLS